jgi:hypothetical protein
MDMFGTSLMFIFRSVNNCLKIIWVTLVAYILGNFLYIRGVLVEHCMHKAALSCADSGFLGQPSAI